MGWIFEVALAGLIIKAIDYGGGTDMWNVSEAKHMQFNKVSNVFSVELLIERRHCRDCFSQK